ncbi:MAG: hypothetical protein EKK57_09750 [Proteobacteria bacterium]|nr:MAG: hypothetical protein EKK57_09750 [Pseudomonadota bacterium]
MKFKPLEKVWITSGPHVYPGIVLLTVGLSYVVLKFDTVIWRRVICLEDELTHRKQDFSEYAFAVRKNFLSI